MIPWLLAAALPAVGGGALLLVHPANEALFLALNREAAAVPPALWAALTNLGATSVAVALLVAIAPWSLRPLWFALWAALPTTLVVHGLKRMVAAPRPGGVLPSDAFAWIDLLPKSGSFPSGHTATAVVLCGSLLYGLWAQRTKTPAVRRGLALLTILLTCAVAFSRIAVGAHWPSDLLGGLGAALVGVAVALVATRHFPEPSERMSCWLVGAAVASATFALWDRGIYPSGAWLVWLLVVAAWLGAFRWWFR
ncbi:hypothetical protein JCM16106_15290 [Hydrogenophilus islandicus]